MIDTTRTTTTAAPDLDTLARRAPATDDLLAVAEWLHDHGVAHLSAIERIELAERLITRRRFLIGTGALGLGVITGCGAEEQASAPTATVGGTRTVEHALGTTEVPMEPQRIAALGVAAAEVALELGIEPIATVDQNFTYPYLDLGNAENVGEMNALNLEALVTADPDLICGLDVEMEQIYEELSEIASTVAVRWPGTSAEWKRIGQSYATVLRGEDGQQSYNEMLTAYEQRAEEVGRRIQQTRGEDFTIAIMRSRPDSQLFELPGIFSGNIVYGDVGLPLPQGLRGPDEEGETTLDVSLEELSRGDADAIFVYAGAGADAREQSTAQIEVLMEEPVFQRLQASESGNVYPVGAHWFYGSKIAANLVLDDLERYLLGEGDA